MGKCKDNIHDFRISGVFYGMYCNDCKLKISMWSFIDYAMLPRKVFERMQRIIKEQRQFKVKRVSVKDKT